MFEKNERCCIHKEPEDTNIGTRGTASSDVLAYPAPPALGWSTHLFGFADHSIAQLKPLFSYHTSRLDRIL
jgi:hypothetical protein